jgi:prephenate dehydrogenase
MSIAVSVVGIGRFGATLGALLDRAKVEWEAVNATPATKRYAPQGKLIVLAVPLDALAEVARAIKPTPDQIIVDVCSVKVRAVEIMREVLGDGRWVATHPLFGPAALRSDDQPRAIVCPRNDRPADTSLVEALWAQIGCTVKLMDAETHDQLMAESQALAAFVGRALRESKLPAFSEWTPPSSIPLHQLSTAITAVPGHLQDTLLYDNPCAEAVRSRLVAALRAVTPSAPRADLEMLRAAIDGVDRTLVELLAQRADLARAVSMRKLELDRPVHDPAREAAAFVDRRQWADESGVDPDFVESFFTSVRSWSRALQEKARAKTK